MSHNLTKEEVEEGLYDAIVNNGSQKISQAEADKFRLGNTATSFSDWLRKKTKNHSEGHP